MINAREREWRAEDLAFFERKGISVAAINHQLSHLKTGSKPVRLLAPCTVGNGLVLLPEAEKSHYIAIFEEARASRRLQKFVPASGAASRMFSSLSNALKENGDPKPVGEFGKSLLDFPFIDDLRRELESGGQTLEQLTRKGDFLIIVSRMLDDQGLGYRDFPKGLLPFHRYSDGSVRTAFEEHLGEAAAYASNQKGLARIHFTVAEKHYHKIEAHLREAAEHLSSEAHRFEVTFSFQKPSTDAISLDETGHALRDEKGRLLLRPSGHGALLENIQDLDGEIVFIKNIDNVVPDHLREPTYQSKRQLGGFLIALQRRVFDFLSVLDEELPNPEALNEIAQFCRDILSRNPGEAFEQGTMAGQIRQLREVLNRPLRVCGMVPVSGEPGGGPFWVADEHGNHSIQIVESAQVDHSDPEQAKIWSASTHFNPVDLVCGIRDYQGKVFDLKRFRDPEACFVSEKSHQGHPIKVFELPGLWNGAMAGWNTVFIEVPASTFNPVKTVFDLLRPEHQMAPLP